MLSIKIARQYVYLDFDAFDRRHREPGWPVGPDGLADLFALLGNARQNAFLLCVTVEAECRGRFDNYESNVTGLQTTVLQVVEFSLRITLKVSKRPVQRIMSPLL
jgi:hypothetical protein